MSHFSRTLLTLAPAVARFHIPECRQFITKFPGAKQNHSGAKVGGVLNFSLLKPSSAIRSAKSGSNWKLNELEAYHISLKQEHPLLFFGLEELPQPSVDEELLTIEDTNAMQKGVNARLVYFLNLAMKPAAAMSEPGVDFVVALFDYLREGWVARTRVKLPLFICGKFRCADTDVCIVDENNSILLLVEDKRTKRLESTMEPINTLAQLVAEAVAAFNKNNMNRKAMGLPPLEDKVMPGIVMLGTLPVFCKIPITQTLATHIRHGTYPPKETTVSYCYPPLPRPAHRSEGMKPLDNRREILKCFEAFKAIIGI